MSTRKVLSVGQCRPDHGRIAHVLRSTFGVEVVAADSAEQAERLLRQDSFNLVLVNRIFDADGDSGIDLIRRVQGDEQLRNVPILLVSNYEEAQAQAIAAGARPGFGKAALQAPATIELLREHL
jgi:two-component system chemotaxis response regulator CheY